MTTAPTLWSAKEIAEYLRIEPKTMLNKIASEGRDFPKPISGARRNRLWLADDVIAHLTKRAA